MRCIEFNLEAHSWIVECCRYLPLLNDVGNGAGIEEPEGLVIKENGYKRMAGKV